VEKKSFIIVRIRSMSRAPVHIVSQISVVRFNCWASWPIFTKICINIMPLDAPLNVTSINFCTVNHSASLESVVVIATGYGLDGRGADFEFL
jgi:hypothetical protein